jgi:hypothetical protein
MGTSIAKTSGELYNYDTFRRDMVKEDMRFSGGPAPGEEAQDFSLPRIDCGRFDLRSVRGVKPVLLMFASITCPMTAGARPALLDLFN